MKTYRIDDASRIVYVEYSGVMTESDLHADRDQYALLGSEYSILIDLSAVTQFAITREALREVALKWSGSARRKGCAVHAPQAAHYGMARMYEMLCESGTGETRIQVFRDLTAAENWLAALRSSSERARGCGQA